jgi:hypothetical protein
MVGAPKCGTTALSEYLRAHPGVFVSDPKEPHYFSDDFAALRVTRTKEEYEGLFRLADESHLAVGEASTGYLYSKTAVSNILAYRADMKLVIMLRNPIDMVYAWHGQRLYASDEDERDFEAAWRLQEERRAGRRIPRKCRHIEFLMYKDFGMLGVQMERLYALCPREQVHVIVFDDFRADTRSVYESTLAFLGVPSDGRTEFPRINEAKRHRIQALGRFSQNPPRVLNEFGYHVRRALGVNRLGFLDPIRKLNQETKTRPPLSDQFRAELAEVFRSDVERLSALTGRDLGHWTSVPQHHQG